MHTDAIPISPDTAFKALSSSNMEPERSIKTYKSRGKFRRGVTLTRKLWGTPNVLWKEEREIERDEIGPGGGGLGGGGIVLRSYM